MAKNIVICCDGTGSEIGSTISNVLKLYRILEQGEAQRVYYNPGVGTIGQQNAWQRFQQEVVAAFGLATGYGLDDDVLNAYRFLCEAYDDGDRIFLFGFSRGAYAVRVLAAFVHVMGLLRPDQINLAGYAFAVYQRASDDSAQQDDEATPLDPAFYFRRVAGGRLVPIEFVGVWDTVASVIVPRQDSFILTLQTLRFTRTNPSVKNFRQAISIDERRRMFRLNRWTEPQRYRTDPFDPQSGFVQVIRQVWFAGTHRDVGGGYLEGESGLSKFPLIWMIEQAHAAGLAIDPQMVNHLGYGMPRAGSSHDYAPPDPAAPLHDSMTPLWEILEWLPKRTKWREWPDRASFLGCYLPRGEPRVIGDGARLHASVVERMRLKPDYRPVNLPASYAVEPGLQGPLA
jgi:uncharacterized protein (DUF2235 family)